MQRSPWTLSPVLVTAAVLGCQAHAQNTIPEWSSYFGGSNYEAITSIARGPGDLLTITGITISGDLPVAQGSLNPTPVQPARRGGYDAFVARIDPTLPASQQLLWCTYLGGSNQDYAFDVAVDANGVATVVGATQSADFPVPAGQPLMPLGGISDGFVVRIDANGGAILDAMLVGGSSGDRISRVHVDAGGIATVLGVTDSSDLPWTAGTAFPAARGGGTDAFVARVIPQAGVGLWATYLGGDDLDGISYTSWANQGGISYLWDGNLDLHDLAVDAAGSIAVVIHTLAGTTAAPTTPGAIQATHAGGDDLWIGTLDSSGSTLTYGTFFGGSSDDLPTGIAFHPDGSLVCCGGTFSTDMPTTAGALQPTFLGCTVSCPNNLTDGFVVHVDPSMGAAGLRYATYLGGDGGEDLLMDLAVESSGVVTTVGYMQGGNYPLTPRAMQTSLLTGTIGGVVARIAMDGQGLTDLVYSSARRGSQGFSMLRTMALDESGDLVAAGATNSTTLPVQNPFQAQRLGGREGHLIRMPMLPGCVTRSGRDDRTPACAEPLHIGMHGVPLPGTTFVLTATGAPAGSLGGLLLGAPVAAVPLLNASLLISPGELLALPIADALGAARVAIPVPANLPAACPWGLSAQWVFLTTPTCPGSGLLANSGRLDL